MACASEWREEEKGEKVRIWEGEESQATGIMRGAPGLSGGWMGMRQVETKCVGRGR